MKKQLVTVLLAAALMSLCGCAQGITDAAAVLGSAAGIKTQIIETAAGEEASAEKETQADEEAADEGQAAAEFGSSGRSHAAVMSAAGGYGLRNMDEDLPASYDGRKNGRVSKVKCQGNQGICWAYAAASAMETALLPEETAEISVEDMTKYPYFADAMGGGEYTMVLAYALSWEGPKKSGADDVSWHLQEAVIIPDGDADIIKRAVWQCGDVQSSVYMDMLTADSASEHYDRATAAYSYKGDAAPNHDIVIVGWDDNYPKERFKAGAQKDGAFICENSWGESFGENGFFYVSYEDANICRNAIAYTSLEATDNYSAIYQADMCGWLGQLGYGEPEAWCANIYTAGADETVKAAGFYATEKDTDYEVYIQKVGSGKYSGSFGERRLAAAGHLNLAGFYTVDFAAGEKVSAGEKFAVILKLKTPGVMHPIAIEYDSGDGRYSYKRADDVQALISPDGNTWADARDLQDCNICLKAYTERP